MTYSFTLHTNTIYSFTFPCKHDILIYFPMKKRYTHLLSHANTTCSFILTYKHDIHVLIYSPMQTQYTHLLSHANTIYSFYPAIHVEPNINTHHYPAIHVEQGHQELSPSHQHPLLSSYSCGAGPPSTHYYPAIHVELAHIYHLPNTV